MFKGTIIKASHEESFDEKLVRLRKNLTKYFNVSTGNKDSILKMKCDSDDYAIKFGEFLSNSSFVKRIELEFREKFEYEVNNNLLLIKFTPEYNYFYSNGFSFSLSNFLFMFKDKHSALSFISKYGISEDNSTVGSQSVQALFRLCLLLKSNRFYIDMIEPK